jgi:hypothetical protein
MSNVHHFISQAPIQWSAKKQNTVEAAIYGSEIIMDLRCKLRMPGINIDGPAWLFGDNESEVTLSTGP